MYHEGGWLDTSQIAPNTAVRVNDCILDVCEYIRC